MWSLHWFNLVFALCVFLLGRCYRVLEKHDPFSSPLSPPPPLVGNIFRKKIKLSTALILKVCENNTVINYCSERKLHRGTLESQVWSHTAICCFQNSLHILSKLSCPGGFRCVMHQAEISLTFNTTSVYIFM